MGEEAEGCGGYESEYDPYMEGLSEGLWTQKSGGAISVSDMSNSHILHTMKICNDAKILANFSCDKEKWEDWIDIFRSELIHRGVGGF